MFETKPGCNILQFDFLDSEEEKKEILSQILS